MLQCGNIGRENEMRWDSWEALASKKWVIPGRPSRESVFVFSSLSFRPT